MQNEAGEMMDLYIPRKCSATNRLITAKDHASVQINIGHLDETGVYTGQFTTLALSGFIRTQMLVSIRKTNESFRLFYDTKGRFWLHALKDEEAKITEFW